ncbi:MAG: DHH family phosphoesterase [Vescimonas coprocola]|uniref:DHH family phosphoesterase n=1 Tax=Vescimonas sp. TaxID=2892404 RepID=UPI002A7EA02A|nr:DHH family phosphoesterase [Vescimonas coprocola]
MNKRIARLLRTNITIFSLCLVLFALAAIPFDVRLAIGEGVAAVAFFLLGRRRSKATQQSLRQYIQRFYGGMDSARSSNMLFTPLPMMVFDLATEDILWSSESFLQLTEQREGIFDAHLETVFPNISFHWLLEGKTEAPETVVWNHRTYRVFGGVSHPEGGQSALATTYWMDVTDTEEMRRTLELTRPVVAILMVDNYEDLMKATPEGKRSAVRAMLEEKLSQWSAGSEGMMLRYDRDRYLFVFEEKSFSDFAAKRFDVLDAVREVVAGEGVAATLSIGVGRDADSFEALFKNASVALEMALSRGGDQAVVKDKLNFEFYGGRSKATEKRTKVKSRVMANALAELIDEAKQVYVMGHSYADMDALGAAAGVCAIVRKRGKKCRIVIDTENNAAHPMLRRLQALPEYQGAFLSGDDAFLRVQPETLLVVVDTNRPGSVESEPLLDACNRVAVIDHHRRGSSYIDKMALNYHEPYASSASELVTELLQYLIEPGDLLKAESEALLAGIVLDTKNFTNRTGGRTFEAAAYLRRAGADTADVQRMFQSDLQSMISRYDIIRRAELYHGDIAIAALDQECDRVIAAKAADEMLTLQGVRASFVLYRKDDGIYISARSLGEINVQVLVETLGGGGNSTTAGGQCSGMTVAEAKATLLRAIDKYFEE